MNKEKKSFTIFGIIWFSQIVSILGSAVTGFSLRVWTFQETNLVIQFSLITFFYAVPGFLVSPFAGALADRGRRVKILIISDIGAGIATFAIWLLLEANQLEIWHIYIVVSIISMAGAFQFPAYSTLTTMLVPKEKLGRANGMIQLGGGFSQTLAPMVGGFLLASIGLQKITLIDIATVTIATLILLRIRLPAGLDTHDPKKKRKSLIAETKKGWAYLKGRTDLLIFMGCQVILSSINGMAVVLIAPMVLGFGNTITLGYVSSFAGIGMILGALTMGAWGGPKHKINGFFGFAFLSSLLLFLGGLQPNAYLVAIASASFLFFNQIYLACQQVIWQTVVPFEIQGRVFALRGMVLTLTIPFAQILIAPLADSVFQPMLEEGGSLADTMVGEVVGVGPGRGIGLMLIMMGILRVFLIMGMFFIRKIRALQQESERKIQESIDAKIA